MPKATQAEVMSALRAAGLEDAGKGVVFPWGVKIVDFNGKKALQGMTPAEYKEAVLRDTGRTLTDAEITAGTCVYADAVCYSQGCPGSCSMHYQGGWYCICSY